MKLGIHCNRLSHLEERILDNGLHHAEFYNLPLGDLPILKRWLLNHEVTMSIHTPLARLEWYPQPPTWCFLCDPDRDKRELNLRMVVETMGAAEDFGAEYVVVHFPAPPQSDISYLSDDRLRDIALGSCDRLAELSAKHGIPIHIEGFGPSPFLNGDFLSQILREFSTLRYCFDTGHMQLSALRDGLDYYAFAQQIAPFSGSLHLWNTRGPDDYYAYRHIPVHPSQKVEAGWVNIARTLSMFRPVADSCTAILESSDQYPRALGNYDYRDGVEWVKELLKE